MKSHVYLRVQGGGGRGRIAQVVSCPVSLSHADKFKEAEHKTRWGVCQGRALTSSGSQLDEAGSYIASHAGPK